MIDYSRFTWCGGHPRMAAACVHPGEQFTASVLCFRETESGMEKAEDGAAGGCSIEETFSLREAEKMISGCGEFFESALQAEGSSPAQLLLSLQQTMREGKRRAEDTGEYCADAGFLTVRNGVLHAALAGNARVWICRGSLLYSPDAETASVNGDSPSSKKAFDLTCGDQILLCTDGFSQYISGTEVMLDGVKSSGAQEWMERMLVRLAEKTRMKGGDFSLVCGMMREAAV